MQGETTGGPELHTLKSNGPAGVTWRVWCATCGWESRGVGEQTGQDADARAHRCPTRDDAAVR
jgi:hypothetical protein